MKSLFQTWLAAAMLLMAGQAQAIIWSQAIGEHSGSPLVVSTMNRSGDNMNQYADVLVANPGKEIVDGYGNVIQNGNQFSFKVKHLVYSQSGTLLLNTGYLQVSWPAANTTLVDTFEGAVLASATGYPDGLLVEAVAVQTQDNSTGAMNNKLVMRVKDPTANTTLWSKTLTDLPQYGTLDLGLSEVTDTDGDGSDDIVVIFFKDGQGGSLVSSHGVFDILTGNLKASTQYTVAP
ncbi:MAG: hypothetical protein D6794_10600 [Deltaproteobacteria bacterium]|nr:MAG: hypothetical protein D6794_10600 [Deltaproteobacteria bacterium]